MDLVYVVRKYKNIKKIIILIFVAVLALYGLLFAILAIKEKNQNEIFKSYQAEKNQLASANESPDTNVSNEKNSEENEKNVATTTKIPVSTDETVSNIKNIYKADTHKAYLTFDDGPSQTVTPQILDLLKEENIKATFFVLGSRVELNPSIVKREYEEGHYIANHGYSHVYSTIYTSVDSVLDEYNKTEQLIREAIGVQEYSSNLFRFPGGSSGGYYSELKDNAKNVLTSKQIAYVDWNALTGDAEDKNTKEEMLEYLKTTVGNKKNVVVLMHDAGNKIATYEALPEVIAFLREQGYEFDNFYSLMD